MQNVEFISSYGFISVIMQPNVSTAIASFWRQLVFYLAAWLLFFAVFMELSAAELKAVCLFKNVQFLFRQWKLSVRFM